MGEFLLPFQENNRGAGDQTFNCRSMSGRKPGYRFQDENGLKYGYHLQDENGRKNGYR